MQVQQKLYLKQSDRKALPNEETGKWIIRLDTGFRENSLDFLKFCFPFFEHREGHRGIQVSRLIKYLE